MADPTTVGDTTRRGAGWWSRGALIASGNRWSSDGASVANRLLG